MSQAGLRCSAAPDGLKHGPGTPEACQQSSQQTEHSPRASVHKIGKLEAKYAIGKNDAPHVTARLHPASMDSTVWLH